MSRTELAQVMPWRERVPWNGTASRGQNTLRVYTILLQGKQPKTTASRGQYCNQLSCKGNLVVKYCKCCICCFLFIPLIPSFSDDSFLCEKRRGLLRALPWNILLVLNSDFYYFYFSVLKIGPWANPINDRLMSRLMMINVKINPPIHVPINDDSC